MKAPDILRQSAQHMMDRATTYDKPEGERSMAKTVQAFNAITGRGITTAEGWLMMAVLKQVRALQNPGKPHVDSLEDAPAYLALMAEEMLSGEPVSESESPAPSEPTPPADRPELAVGQVWKSRTGLLITVAKNPEYPKRSYYPFKAAGGDLTYLSDGRGGFDDEYSDCDLIELIQDENGWIPWKATKDSVCPVSENTPVRVRLCDKTESVRYAGHAYWDDTPSHLYRIEAYKVVQ